MDPKYDIEVSKSVDHDKEINEKNGNSYWKETIAKEMYNISMEFKILEDHESMLVGWTLSSVHVIFDVKMDFKLKEHWVKDGHKLLELESL